MQQNANNIITFPSKNNKQSLNPKTIEEISANMEMIKHVHIQETIETIAPILFEQISTAGFALDEEGKDELEIKIGAFIVESIRCLLLKHYDMEHPFHAIAENIFVYDNEETLTINKKFSILIRDKIESEKS
jgi:hypothetical protein